MTRMTKADFKLLKGQTVAFAIVAYNEDVKIRLVNYGVDVKHKEMTSGGDFKVIAK